MTDIEWTVNRLTELRAEYANGNTQLADLARRERELRASVLRIEGAIQVLEEQIAQSPALAEKAPYPVPGSTP